MATKFPKSSEEAMALLAEHTFRDPNKDEQCMDLVGENAVISIDNEKDLIIVINGDEVVFTGMTEDKDVNSCIIYKLEILFKQLEPDNDITVENK